MNDKSKYHANSSEQYKTEYFRKFVPAYSMALYYNLDRALELLEKIAIAEKVSNEFRRGSEILESALYHARRDSENGRSRGNKFIAAIELKLENLADERKFTHSGGLMLISCWRYAGLKPATTFTRTTGGITEGLASIASKDPEGVTRIRRGFEKGIDMSQPDALYFLLDSYSSYLPTMPEVFQYELVLDAVASKREIYADLGYALLLQDNQSVRSAVIDGFTNRLTSGQFSAKHIEKLTTVRNWLTDDATVNRIDGVVQQAMQRGLKVIDSNNKIKVHRLLATMVDGTGSQVVTAAVQNGKTRYITRLFHKQGYGIKEAKSFPCESANQQRETIESALKSTPDLEETDVSMELLKNLVRIALYDGFKHKVNPDPGLVEFSQVMGLSDIGPSIGTVEDILSIIDPEGRIIGKSETELEGLMAGSANWKDKFAISSNWFEKDDEIDHLLGTGKPEEQVWSYLDSRRDFWAMCFGRNALIVHDIGSDTLDSFIAVLKAMSSGWDLKRIPIMVDVLDRTIGCWEEDNGLRYEEKLTTEFLQNENSTTPEDEIQNDTEGLEAEFNEFVGTKKWSKRPSKWLIGFSTGVVTTPIHIPFDSMLPYIVNKFHFNEGGKIKVMQLMKLLTKLVYSLAKDYEQADVYQPLPLDSVDFAEWAAGFLTVWDHFPLHFPDELVGFSGKRTKFFLEEAAKEIPIPEEEFAVASQWVRKTFEFRRSIKFLIHLPD